MIWSAALQRASLQTVAIARERAGQLLTIGAVGTALGAFVAATALLPPRWAGLLLVLAACPFLLLVIGHVRCVLLLLVLVDIPFQFDMYLGYDRAATGYGSISGWNIALMTPVLALLYGLWFCEVMARQGPLAHARPRIVWPVALYTLVVAASAGVAYAPRFASFELAILVQGVLLLMYVYSTVRQQSEWMFLVCALLMVYILQCVAMLVGLVLGPQFLRALGLSSLYTNDPFIDMRRLTGSFGSPNVAGAYLSLLLTPAVGLMLGAQRRGERLLGGIAACLGAVCLVLTFSRGGWSGAAVALALFIAAAWRMGWLTPTFPLLGGLGAVAFLLVFQNALLERLLGDDSGAAYSRVPLMQIAFAMISDHPVLGIGANNFGQLLPRYATAEFSQVWLYLVHSKYLLVWAETGIIGLLSFVALLATTVWAGWQACHLLRPPVAPIVAAFAATIIGQSVHMLVEIFNGRPQIQLLLLVVALVHSARLMSCEEQTCRAAQP